MFAKGVMEGYSPKENALKLLPKGTKCVIMETIGDIKGYVVYLPEGIAIASARSSKEAWEKAHNWAIMHRI